MSDAAVLYMHTIDGKPATWSKADGQIVFADVLPRWQDVPLPALLRRSVRQIKTDQRRTAENRKAWGMNDGGAGELGYVLVQLPNNTGHTPAPAGRR